MTDDSATDPINPHGAPKPMIEWMLRDARRPPLVKERAPAFLLTIDTEGDDLWSRPREITTRNLAFLPRFQALCERFGFKPTYLTNWEALNDEGYQRFAKDVLARGQGEVGLHIHSWNSPPLIPLTADDFRYQPYLTEYPEALLREKVRVMTDGLEQVFGRKMLSHRGGRWAFDSAYARALVDNGYWVDCSVTPHRSWRSSKGDPAGHGGPDHSGSPAEPYYIEFGPGAPRLLELPMTIVRRPCHGPELWLRKALGKQSYRADWMRPDGRNLRQLLQVVDDVVAQDRDYLEFTLHSSEFMPGGSPTFRTGDDVERLYVHLEILFERVSQRFVGATLCDFAQHFMRRRGPPADIAYPPGGYRWTPPITGELPLGRL
ncbi:hypothetical protein LJR225_002416 [Phenylobacterium sp. LjRoot225]|uniref:hypothetical protein n=1 Tax=Phenylobacterium sp. LjRoot225 TaxID=3342285 RepID=UPI003ECEC2D4